MESFQVSILPWKIVVKAKSIDPSFQVKLLWDSLIKYNRIQINNLIAAICKNVASWDIMLIKIKAAIYLTNVGARPTLDRLVEKVIAMKWTERWINAKIWIYYKVR